MRLFSATLVALISLVIMACVSPKSVSEDIEGIARGAEKYMERNGFTPSGHPKDLPVNQIEVLDQFFLSNEAEKIKLLNNRKGRIRGPAYCISQKQNEYFVVFSKPTDACQIVVNVSQDGEPRLMHGCIALDFLKPCNLLFSASNPDTHP